MQLEKLVWKSILGKNYGVLSRASSWKGAKYFKQSDIEKNQLRLTIKPNINLTDQIVISETESNSIFEDQAIFSLSDGRNVNSKKFLLEAHIKIPKTNQPFQIKIIENPLQLEGAALNLALSVNQKQLSSNDQIAEQLIIDLNVPNFRQQKCGIYPGFFPISGINKTVIYCESDVKNLQ